MHMVRAMRDADSIQLLHAVGLRRLRADYPRPLGEEDTPWASFRRPYQCVISVNPLDRRRTPPSRVGPTTRGEQGVDSHYLQRSQPWIWHRVR